MRFELVIFDLDGVLVDSEVLACRVLAEVLTAQGCPISAEEVMTRFTGLTDQHIAEVLSRERGLTLPTNFSELASDRAIACFEWDLTAMPGAAAALSTINSSKCVASNSGNQRVVRSLRATGLDLFFSPAQCFSAEDVARPKPAPDLHRLAARTMGSAPAACVVVEDSVTGVQAAIAAGMTAIGFVGASHVSDDQADSLLKAGATRVVDKFESLPGILGH